MTSSKPNHRERKQLARARRRVRHVLSQTAKKLDGCPTPTKRAFRDQAAAIGECLTLAHRSGKAWAPYECACGRWHVTGADRYQAVSRRRAAADPAPPAHRPVR